MEIAKERHSQWNTLLSLDSLLHVVCISMFLALCSKSLQSTDLGIQKKTCVSVWLLVCSSEVGVLFHYAHVYMLLKTDTRQKIRGERSCTHVMMYTCTDRMETLRHTHRRAH